MNDTLRAKQGRISLFMVQLADMILGLALDLAGRRRFGLKPEPPKIHQIHLCACTNFM